MPKNWGKRPWTVDFGAKRVAFPPAVDFAVVGAGFTGLAAAAWLKTHAPEKSVALFEAKRVGDGSSGHTGGMVLGESAVGDLPGLGDVLAGYREILGKLGVVGDLSLPGVYELGRKNPLKNSPIDWKDSGNLQAVKEVPGGSINPGKVVGGLARAAESVGVLVLENAALDAVRFANGLELRSAAGITKAGGVLFATNAFSLEQSELRDRAKSAFTTAILTEPLRDETLKQIGLSEGKPFYTVDMPYLWGRLLGNAVIFGSGLVFMEDWRELNELDIEVGEANALYVRLEQRIRKLHPVLQNVNFTHRWGGPICIAEGWKPVFERHPESENAIVLGAYSGHGVAQSVYLGAWAAEVLLGKRCLPNWK